MAYARDRMQDPKELRLATRAGIRAARLSLWIVGALLVTLGAMAGVIGWQAGRLSASTSGQAAESSVYPPLLSEFRLPSLAGEELGPADFAGKAVLVEFWATWCGPCRAQAAILSRLYGELSRDEVEFLAVSVGEDRDTVERFVAREPFPYPVLLDSESQVSDAARIFALPTVMILDPEGGVVFLEEGLATKRALAGVFDRIAAASSEKKPMTAASGAP